jgi:UDP-GlcNAc:undecaprenyl-phosphate/decaprenyl-phosphate GlcNAc-1-phosphate transferase
MMLVAAGLLLLASLSLSAALTPLSRRVARGVGMIDHPLGRKNHAAPTPLLGGSAIMGTIALLTLAGAATIHWFGDSLPESLGRHVPGAASRLPMMLGILAGAVALHVLGLIDDRRHLGARVKLLGQLIVAAAVVVFCDVRILTMAGPAVSIAATILWLVAVMNAFNLLDNMDGLSVGVAAICAAALLATTAQTGQFFVSAWLCVVLGAMLGYLPFNFPPASTFMGDAGSLVIGFFLGVLSCLTSYVEAGESVSFGAMLVPLVIMAVPMYDMLSVVVLRLQDGKSILVGDHRHFSHRLVRRGMGARSAVLTIYLCTAGTAVAACILPHTNNVGALLVAGQAALILLIIALLEWGGRSGDNRPANEQATDCDNTPDLS